MLALWSLLQSEDAFQKKVGWILFMFLGEVFLFFLLCGSWFPHAISTAEIWRDFAAFFPLVVLLALTPTAVCLWAGARCSWPDGGKIPRPYYFFAIVFTLGFCLLVLGVDDSGHRRNSDKNIYEILGLASIAAGLSLIDLILTAGEKLRRMVSGSTDSAT